MKIGDPELRWVLENLRALTESPYLLNRVIDQMEGVLLAKGEDYSTEAELWDAFHKASQMIGQDPILGFRYMVAHKVGRALNLVTSKKPPNFETEYDTWQDLLGYILLMMAYMKYVEDK